MIATADSLPPRPNLHKGHAYRFFGVAGFLIGIAAAIAFYAVAPSTIGPLSRGASKLSGALILGACFGTGSLIGWILRTRADRQQQKELNLELAAPTATERQTVQALLDRMRPVRFRGRQIEEIVLVAGFDRRIIQCDLEVRRGKHTEHWSATVVRVPGANLPACIAGAPRRLGKLPPRKTAEQGRLGKKVQVAALHNEPIERVMPRLGPLSAIIADRPEGPKWYHFAFWQHAEQWAIADDWIMYATTGKFRPQHRADAVIFISAVADAIVPTHIA